MMTSYELFVQVALVDADFDLLFSNLDIKVKTELLDFIKFLKTKPTKEEFYSYKVSREVIEAYKFFIAKLSEKLN